MSSVTSMSAAGSASITTARAAISTARRTTRSRNTRTTSSGTSWTSATPRASPHPAIVSEGGRAIVAHHSVLVVEAFGSIEKTAPKLKVEVTEKDHKLVRDILDVKQRLKRGNRLESLHDAQQIKEEAQQMFDLGLLDLEAKAKIETRLLAARAADRRTCIAACASCRRK